MKKLFARITFLTIAFLLTNFSSCQDIHELNDSKDKILKDVIWNFQNTPNFFSVIFSKDSVSQIIDKGDTIIYKPISADEVKIIYTFINDTCSEIKLQFACLVCLNMTYRKWLFRGKWRLSNDGFLYNNRIPVKAYLKRTVNCPYLYEVKLIKLDNPIEKIELKKMEKVNKKLIGTNVYYFLK